jgi:hypothetical protein
MCHSPGVRFTPRVTPISPLIASVGRKTEGNSQVGASSLVLSLGFRRGKRNAARHEGALSDEDYVALGKTSNSGELSSSENQAIFRLLEEEEGEGFAPLFEVPFSLKHVKELHVVMRHVVAITDERREDLTRHPLFHPVFAAFTLGFSIGLAEAHRGKHTGFRVSIARLSGRQAESCNEWGVEVATYYLAMINAHGIFGKEADIDNYGIPDKWRLLSDDRRLDPFERLKDCVAAGKRAAHLWFADDTADVPPHFVETLVAFVDAYPDRRFD